MALSFHQVARLKWLKKQLASLERSRSRRQITIQKRINKLMEPVSQIDADIMAITNEIASLESKIVGTTEEVGTVETGGLV